MPWRWRKGEGGDPLATPDEVLDKAGVASGVPNIYGMTRNSRHASSVRGEIAVLDHHPPEVHEPPFQNLSFGWSQLIFHETKRDNLEEVAAHFLQGLSGLVLYVRNECGSDRGGQIGLIPWKPRSTTRPRSKRKTTHKDQHGIQIPIVSLHHTLIILIGFVQRLIVEPDAGTTDSSKEVWKERW